MTNVLRLTGAALLVFTVTISSASAQQLGPSVPVKPVGGPQLAPPTAASVILSYVNWLKNGPHLHEQLSFLFVDNQGGGTANTLNHDPLKVDVIAGVFGVQGEDLVGSGTLVNSSTDYRPTPGAQPKTIALHGANATITIEGITRYLTLVDGVLVVRYNLLDGPRAASITISIQSNNVP